MIPWRMGGGVEAVENGAVGRDPIVAELEKLRALIGDDAAGAALDRGQPGEAGGAIAIDQKFVDVELRHPEHRRCDGAGRLSSLDRPIGLGRSASAVRLAGARGHHRMT